MLKKACQECHKDNNIPWNFQSDRDWDNDVVQCPVITKFFNVRMHVPLSYQSISDPLPMGCKYALEHAINDQ